VTANREFIIADTHLKPLWSAIHDRLCSGADPGSLHTVKVEGLSTVGVATLRTWLDTTTRRRRGNSSVATSDGVTSVPLRELLRVLKINADEVQSLVEQAVGQPVINRSAIRQHAAARREDLWAYASEQLPKLPLLVKRMRAAGVGEDDIPLRKTIDALASATARLPSNPPVSLAKLAHDCADDPHFFDLDGLPGKRLVSAVAELSRREEPERPDRVRVLLAEVGVIADRLSATVLLHNVRVIGDGPIDRRLRDSTTPVALTLLDLTRHPPVFAPQILTVVENPSVLEAVMTAERTHAFAVTSGQLGSVDHALLQLAHDQGITLRYSGDLDSKGLQIAAAVVRDYGAKLLAMDIDTVKAFGSMTALNTGGQVIFQENDIVLSRLLTPLALPQTDDHL
jgi:uncharacterized protein (TIGR02679 family)